MEDLVVRRKEPHRQVGETRQKKGEKVLTMKEKKKKKWKRPEEASKKEEGKGEKWIGEGRVVVPSRRSRFPR